MYIYLASNTISEVKDSTQDVEKESEEDTKHENTTTTPTDDTTTTTPTDDTTTTRGSNSRACKKRTADQDTQLATRPRRSTRQPERSDSDKENSTGKC